MHPRILAGALLALFAQGCFLFEGDPVLDAGTGVDASSTPCPPGLGFFGECDGTLLRWCQDGELLEAQCRIGDLGVGECFELDSEFGNVCGTREGEPCYFDDGAGGRFVVYCQAPATGCIVGGEGSVCAAVAACTEASVGTCSGQRAIVLCQQGQPTLFDCASIGGACREGEYCVDMPEGGYCEDGLFACAAGLRCVGSVCMRGDVDAGTPTGDAGMPDAGPPPPPCVWPGDLAIFSQASLDAFRDSGCDEVERNVTLNGTTLTALRGLERLRVIGGELRLANCNLTDLSALSNLDRTSGVEIASCDALPDLDGLESLTSTVLLTIFDNASLTHIRALRNLREVGDEIGEDSIIIRDNPMLSSLQGLEGVRVANYLTVAGCPRLSNLDGLRNLQTVNLMIELTSIGGTTISLSGLQTAGTLVVSDDDSATSIAFGALTNIDNRLAFSRNDVLTSFSFPALTRVGSNFTVQLNPMLSQCLVDSFHADLVAGGFTGTTAFGGNLACP